MILPLETWLDIYAAFMLAYFVRRWAVALGLLTGGLIACLVAIAEGNARLFPVLFSLELAGGEVYFWAHVGLCGLLAWVFRGFLNGSIQSWWRLL